MRYLPRRQGLCTGTGCPRSKIKVTASRSVGFHCFVVNTQWQAASELRPTQRHLPRQLSRHITAIQPTRCHIKFLVASLQRERRSGQLLLGITVCLLWPYSIYRIRIWTRVGFSETVHSVRDSESGFANPVLKRIHQRNRKCSAVE